MNIVSSTFAQILQAAEDKDVAKLSQIQNGIEATIEAGKKLKVSQGELRDAQAAYILNLHYLGRVLDDIVPHGGARYRGRNLEDTLLSLGVDKHLSAKARKYGEIDYEDIRLFIEEAGDEINPAFLLRLYTESTTEPKPYNDREAWRVVISTLQDYADKGQDGDRVAMVKGWLEEARDG